MSYSKQSGFCLSFFRSETPGTVECESLFLARLNFIWKGFINMPSVAKFVIKAYPVSGSFDYLTEVFIFTAKNEKIHLLSLVTCLPCRLIKV